MSNQNVPQMPKLGDLFFATCSTAIKNCAWKYSDFEKVKFVEGQLAALYEFSVFLQKKAQPQTAMPMKEADQPADVPADQPAEQPPVQTDKTLEEAVNEDDAFGEAAENNAPASEPTPAAPAAPAAAAIPPLQTEEEKKN